MSSNSFLTRMGVGIVGAVTRESETITEPVLFGATPPAIGSPAKISGNGVIAFAGAEVEADIAGVICRTYPTQSATNALGAVASVAGAIGDMTHHGYIAVKVNGATEPARNGAVYIRVGNATAEKPIGGFEAADDGADCIEYAKAKFMGARDANGVAEIWINS